MHNPYTTYARAFCDLAKLNVASGEKPLGVQV